MSTSQQSRITQHLCTTPDGRAFVHIGSDQSGNRSSYRISVGDGTTMKEFTVAPAGVETYSNGTRRIKADAPGNLWFYLPGADAVAANPKLVPTWNGKPLVAADPARYNIDDRPSESVTITSKNPAQPEEEAALAEAS